MKELLRQEPGLVNAAWDWGGGDWKTALGTAAHMGEKTLHFSFSIKELEWIYLRLPLLGKIDIVRSMLTDNPSSEPLAHTWHRAASCIPGLDGVRCHGINRRDDHGTHGRYMVSLLQRA
jgi:hypothetical protein